jgi:hypothetical protein
MEQAVTMSPEMGSQSTPAPQPAKVVKPQETPSDWLKPKIFKSSNLL